MSRIEAKITKHTETIWPDEVPRIIDLQRSTLEVEGDTELVEAIGTLVFQYVALLNKASR